MHHRKWIDEQSYADLVALCQFLPGPASSKVGIAIGIIRVGLPGGALAWLGFTLPSALALVAFAYGLSAFGAAGDAGWLHRRSPSSTASFASARSSSAEDTSCCRCCRPRSSASFPPF